MIQHSEIKNLETEWGLCEDVIEKDYVISWLLWGIGSHPKLYDAWIFKGGTCLKKCYFETYRFSEDLDFTVLPQGPFTPDDVLPIRGIYDSQSSFLIPPFVAYANKSSAGFSGWPFSAS